MAQAVVRNHNFETHFIATAAVSPRTLFQKHGKVYAVCGEDQIGIGEQVVGRMDKKVEITKANEADVFAEDADVFYDPATNTATLAVVGAGYKAGIAQALSGANKGTVMVLLNF